MSIAVRQFPTMPEDTIPEKEAIKDMTETIIFPEDLNDGNIDENSGDENESKTHSGIFDSSGVEFDEAIHIGIDNKTKTGKFRKKTVKNRDDSSNEISPPNNAGETFTRLFLGLGVTVFGTDFAPDNQKEYDGLKYSFDNWARENDVNDLPPNIALVLAVSMYTINKVAQKPTCKQSFKERVGLKAQKIYIWWKEKRAKNSPQVKKEI